MVEGKQPAVLTLAAHLHTVTVLSPLASCTAIDGIIHINLNYVTLDKFQVDLGGTVFYHSTNCIPYYTINPSPPGQTAYLKTPPSHTTL